MKCFFAFFHPLFMTKRRIDTCNFTTDTDNVQLQKQKEINCSCLSLQEGKCSCTKGLRRCSCLHAKYMWCLCVCWTNHQFHFLLDLRKVAAIRPYGDIYRIAHSATPTLDPLTLSDKEAVCVDKLNLAPPCHLTSCLGHSQKKGDWKLLIYF